MNAQKEKQNVQTLKLVPNQDGWKNVVANEKQITIPTDWSVANVADSIKTLQNQKSFQITSSKVLATGTFPVISQEKDYINGYTNEISKVIANSDGYIVWGDHTTILKYVDFDFVLGGDGTKVFQFSGGDTQFLSYALRGKIAPTGYNRHFKLLKEFEFAHPSPPEQQCIATVLTSQESRIEDLRAWAQTERDRLTWLTDELLSGRVRVVERIGEREVVVEQNADGQVVEGLGAYELVANQDGWKNVEVNGEAVVIPSTWQCPEIGDFSTMLRGKGLSKSMVDKSTENETACILYGHLFTTYGPEIHEVKYSTKHSDGLLGISNDVLVPSSTTTTGEDLACASCLLVNGTMIGSDTIVVRPNSETHGAWLSRKIRTMRQEIGMVASGLTIKHLYGKDLAKIQVVTPPHSEQQRIAAVLSAQERQIADIEQLIELEQQRLSWLTDELLSGRVRVVENT